MLSRGVWNHCHNVKKVSSRTQAVQRHLCFCQTPMFFVCLFVLFCSCLLELPYVKHISIGLFAFLHYYIMAELFVSGFKVWCVLVYIVIVDSLKKSLKENSCAATTKNKSFQSNYYHVYVAVARKLQIVK